MENPWWYTHRLCKALNTPKLNLFPLKGDHYKRVWIYLPTMNFQEIRPFSEGHMICHYLLTACCLKLPSRFASSTTFWTLIMFDYFVWQFENFLRRYLIGTKRYASRIITVYHFWSGSHVIPKGTRRRVGWITVYRPQFYQQGDLCRI